MEFAANSENTVAVVVAVVEQALKRTYIVVVELPEDTAAEDLAAVEQVSEAAHTGDLVAAGKSS